MKNQLDIQVDDEIFGNDRKVVLGYISSDNCWSRYSLQIESSRLEAIQIPSNGIMLKAAVIQKAMPHKDCIPRRKIK